MHHDLSLRRKKIIIIGAGVLAVVLILIAAFLFPNSARRTTTDHHDDISGADYSTAQTGGDGASTPTILGLPNLANAGVLDDEIAFIQEKLSLLLRERYSKKAGDIVSINKEGILFDIDSKKGVKKYTFTLHVDDRTLTVAFISSNQASDPPRRLHIIHPDGAATDHR